jgi:hypothetical protein
MDLLGFLKHCSGGMKCGFIPDDKRNNYRKKVGKITPEKMIEKKGEKKGEDEKKESKEEKKSGCQNDARFFFVYSILQDERFDDMSSPKFYFSCEEHFNPRQCYLSDELHPTYDFVDLKGEYVTFEDAGKNVEYKRCVKVLSDHFLKYLEQEEKLMIEETIDVDEGLSEEKKIDEEYHDEEKKKEVKHIKETYEKYKKKFLVMNEKLGKQITGKKDVGEKDVGEKDVEKDVDEKDVDEKETNNDNIGGEDETSKKKESLPFTNFLIELYCEHKEFFDYLRKIHDNFLPDDVKGKCKDPVFDCLKIIYMYVKEETLSIRDIRDLDGWRTLRNICEFIQEVCEFSGNDIYVYGNRLEDKFEKADE